VSRPICFAAPAQIDELIRAGKIIPETRTDLARFGIGVDNVDIPAATAAGIVVTKVPEVSSNLADQIARIVRSIRQLDLKKAPSVSETIDWARTLVLLGIDHIEAQQAKETLHILLKYQTDIAKAAKELSVDK